MSLRKTVCRSLLRVMGWSAQRHLDLPCKCVICLAPHTSNWDFIYGLLCYYAFYNHRPRFLMKKEWFFFPMGYLFRALGGIPTDRSHHSSLTDQIAESMDRNEFFRICITPEGTRSAVDEWKKGFYFIARKADVPIVLAYIDYEKKSCGLVKTMETSENMKSDLSKVRDFYSAISARYPEKFLLPVNM